LKAQIKKEMLEIEKISKEFDESIINGVTSLDLTQIEPNAYKAFVQGIVYKMLGDKDAAEYFVYGIDTHEMIDKKFK
jgi:hypothetical protein